MPCTPTPGVYGAAPGMHTASMVARLPHGEYLQTSEVSFELRCDPSIVLADASTPADAAATTAPSTLPDAGPDDGGEPASPSSAKPSALDAQTAVLDATAVVDNPPAQSADTSAPDAESSDCSLQPGGGGGSGAWWASLGTLALLGFRRRRQR